MINPKPRLPQCHCYLLAAKDHRITAQDLTDMKRVGHQKNPDKSQRVLKVYQSATDARVSALDCRPKDWAGIIDNEPIRQRLKRSVCSLQ